MIFARARGAYNIRKKEPFYTWKKTRKQSIRGLPASIGSFINIRAFIGIPYRFLVFGRLIVAFQRLLLDAMQFFAPVSL